MSCKSNVAALIAAGIITLTGFNVVADDYLKALEAEAGAIDSGSSNSGANAEFGGQLPKGMDTVEFEIVLQKHFSTTYNFYKKLESKDQEDVYGLYQIDPNIEKIRKLVTTRFIQ